MDMPQGPPPSPGLPPPPVTAPTNVRTFAMLCHLSAFGGFFVPLGNVWGPLIFWLIKRDEMPEVDAHGKESLNFQLSMSIYVFVSFILSFLLIGIPLLIATAIFWLVAVIVASVRANNGDFYRYPLTIRFIN